MGVPIIVSTLSDNVVGMRLRGVIRFLCRNFDLSKYLSLHPLSANGILCNNFRYLLVLFLALSYFSLRRILAYFYGKVNESFDAYLESDACREKLARGISVSEIADALEETEETIRQLVNKLQQA